MVDIFPVTWDPQYAAEPFHIVCRGKTRGGETVRVAIEFPCFLYVKLGGVGCNHAGRLASLVASTGADPAISCQVTRTDMWGFHPHKEAFAQLGYRTHSAHRKARDILKQNKSRVYEGSVDPVLRLCHIRELSPTGWIRISHPLPPGGGRVRYQDVHKSPLESCPPLVFASWDIECYSSTKGFPVAHNDGDCVIQIATAFQVYGEPEPYKRTVVTLGPCSDISGVEVLTADTELAVFQAWVDLVKRESTDVLLGYNIWNFDWRYLADRLETLVDDDGTLDANPFRSFGGDGCLVDSKLSTAAYGDNTFTRIATPGILQIDVLQYLRREYKLESYSLKNVAKTFLQDEKIDLPAWRIFELFEAQTPEASKEVAEYAVRDTELPLQLVWKLNIFERLTQMGVATCVPLEYLLLRGQQIKVWSLILRKARSMGFLVPDNQGIGASEKYAGATVLEANVGAHFDIVSALDFASLYPSIMRAHNMCYSTMIYEGLGREDHRQVDSFADPATHKTISFVQDVPAVVPSLLEELAAFRKAAKREMAAAKTAGDEWKEALHDASQLAFKVSMNSVYGFLGATKGILPCVPIAAAVTGTGRQMLVQVQELVKDLVPGSRVVYGDTDSVMCVFSVPDEKRYDMAHHHALAGRVAAQITQVFKYPIELEFEKTYYPFLLFSKKRYCGGMYTSPTRMDKIDTKGIQMVRRGTIPFVKRMCLEVLNDIMVRKSPEQALATASRYLEDFLGGRVDISDLVLSKALRSGYKNDAQPHVAVARKIFQRRGTPVPLGERVPYVFVRNVATLTEIQANRAEDPDFVVQHQLELDRLYYLDHQILPPLENLLDLLDPRATQKVLASVKETVDGLRDATRRDIKEHKRVRTNERNRQQEITSFFAIDKDAL